MCDATVTRVMQSVRRVLSELPAGVELVAAAKSQPPQAILAAIEAGVRIIGENYVQEAERAYELVGQKAKWHFIGHLQKNKVKRAVKLFDMIQTVDSIDIAGEIDQRCREAGKVMLVLIEVNSGGERQKAGVPPEAVELLVKEIAARPNIKVVGLMTMGPRVGHPEDARPYFTATRQVFDHIKKLNPPGVEMKYLSMGMSNSYRVALEEGANMVRLGGALFGERTEEKGEW